MNWLTPKQAGLLIGVSPSTVRLLIANNKLTAKRINTRGDRRISRSSVREYLGEDQEPDTIREALYARVSGRGDQLSSLTAQEQELRASAQGEIVLCVREIGSGLKENRKGLKRLIKAAEQGKLDLLTVTYADRLTRFGFQTLTELFNSYGVEVRVLHDTCEDAQEELMQDFMSLIASFSGRLYGQRSAAARERLLTEAANE